jgi:hypothetical protein
VPLRIGSSDMQITQIDRTLVPIVIGGQRHFADFHAIASLPDDRLGPSLFDASTDRDAFVRLM